jgi:hypothetical protein
MRQIAWMFVTEESGKQIGFLSPQQYAHWKRRQGEEDEASALPPFEEEKP